MDLRPSYEGRTALVTGAAGFVGSHVVDQLVELGANVRALDDLSDGETENLRRSWDRIQFHRHSIVQPDGLDEIVSGCEYVFHLGANASVPRSADKPEYDFAANVIGTHNVMEAFRRAGAGRLIFTSSAAVYGEPIQEPMDEDHPLIPKSPYGGSKLSGEFLLDAYARCYGYDHRRLRLFNTYGPRQRKYVMFDLLEKLRKNPARLEILGTGEQVRDYNYVGDTVTAILLVGSHPDARGNVYNVSGMNPINIKQLAALIVEVLEIEPPQVTYTGDSWKGDIQRMLGDTTRLQRLGYRPTEGLAEGIRKLVEWHREAYSPPW
jgi:UDP-glucose 4-epimerase